MTINRKLILCQSSDIFMTYIKESLARQNQILILIPKMGEKPDDRMG